MAERPAIAPGGVVNAAAYTEPVVAGSIMTIFGTDLADAVYTAAKIPLPTTLGGTSVTVGGIAAPLFYVSPTQINAEVPVSVPFRPVGYTNADVVVTTSAGVSAPVAAKVTDDSPGVFTTTGTGCGQASALNVAPDGNLSSNSPSNSAAPGDFVEIFGTGFGQSYNPPADGYPALAPQTLRNLGGIIIDGDAHSPLSNFYFGLAPNLVGVHQANFQVPIETREGCAVPLAIEGAYIVSPTVFISVGPSRGQCVDPPQQSYGAIALVKTISTGTGADGETDTLTASFPSGPLLSRQVESQSPANDYAMSRSAADPLRICPVPGYSQLSVGALTVSAPDGSTTTAQGSSTGSATYSQSLPPGFLAAGTYHIAADGGSNVGSFQTTVTLDPAIQVTAVPTHISLNQPITVRWSGGSPGSVVRVSLVDDWEFMTTFRAFGYASSTAGSFTFQPSCSATPVPNCNLPLPGLSEIVIEQMPATDRISTFQVSGITDNVQASYTYRYVFGPKYLSGMTSSAVLSRKTDNLSVGLDHRKAHEQFKCKQAWRPDLQFR